MAFHLFEDTVLSGKSRPPRPIGTRFIKAMHPKSEIRPTREAIERTLKAGWVGQLKIHGHRAQVHISPDAAAPLTVYTRQGDKHKIDMPDGMVKELRRLFQPRRGFTVLDCEWLKPEKRLYIFDLLREDGELLQHLTYPERHAKLPTSFISPFIKVLPVFKTLEKCIQALAEELPSVEGLVFKSSTRPGFGDTSIIRCRRNPGNAPR